MSNTLPDLRVLANKDRVHVIKQTLTKVLKESTPTDAPNVIGNIVREILGQEYAVVIVQQFLTELVDALEKKSFVLQNEGTRKIVVKDTLDVAHAEQAKLQGCERQLNSLKVQYADILEEEEEFIAAARVLSTLSMDSGGRSLPDEEKCKTYIRIVRLYLEEEESGQAESYFNRAAQLINSTEDQVTQVLYKLCQARIYDYQRKFLEAATRFHELSWIGEMDEEERTMSLSAAVTCAVLAPAGPNRSRVLASLCRDERTSQLPSYNILTKMFLDRILRQSEVQEFEKTLKPHQLAKIAVSSNDRLAARAGEDDDEDTRMGDGDTISSRTGPSTVLDRAVLEHNLLASSKIYNNITFRGLGALLDLTPGAAETMARRMIEQQRLKGWIDQVDRLIWFESGKEEDDAQGKAGGLGDVEIVNEDTGAPFTKKWDAQIRMTAANVESIAQRLLDEGLVAAAS